MKNTFIQTLTGSVAAATALACAPASATDILARVISSTPVVQQVAVPRQVCTNEAVVTQAPKSGAGALMGAIAGGAAGNAIGSGGGRAVATMLGIFGGAIVGDNIEGPNTQVQNVQQCSTQTFYENRASYFNVVYEYQGAQYSAQMPRDPGPYVRLQITPIGALPSTSPAQPYQAAPQTTYPPAQPSQPPQQQPQQPYFQPAPVPQQVYMQPVLQAPVVYPVSYNSPYYAPIGLSLNLGWAWGFGHHRH